MSVAANQDLSARRILTPLQRFGEPIAMGTRIGKTGGQTMLARLKRSQAIAITAVALPIGMIAAYLAFLIVPQVVRAVVPAVVQQVVEQ